MLGPLTRTSTFIASLTLAANPPETFAQARTRGPLSVSVVAGYQFETAIWSVAQPYGAGAETLRLGNKFAGGLALWAAAEWTFATHFELEAVLRYLELPIRRTCAPIRLDPQSGLDRACRNTNAKVVNGSYGGAIAVLYRPLPQAGWSPYFRTGVGYLSQDVSTVQVFGLFRDLSPRNGSMSVDAAIGLDGPWGARRQWYVEVGDLVFAADRVTAPADSSGITRTSARVVHYLGARVGMRIDLVAEAKR